MKWLRFYLDFCSKYRHDASNSDSIIAFQKKLLEKRQSERQRQQASHAIRLYLNVNQANTASISPSFLPVSTFNNAENANTRESLIPSTTNKSPLDIAPTVLATPKKTLKREPETTEEPTPRTVPKFTVKPVTGVSWVVPFTRLEKEIQIRHYSPKPLKTYRHWLKRFQAFTRSKPPESLSAVDVKEFLTWQLRNR